MYDCRIYRFGNGAFQKPVERGYNHITGTFMRRSWNWFVWIGFGIALLAAFSFIPFFSRFPSTRDLPWANLLLFLAAGCFLAIGLYRAFAQAERYRGKISGAVLSALSFMIFALFCFGVFYAARNLPPAHTAVQVGQRAPDFTLADTDGKQVTLSQLRQGKRAVLLIFYRGYW